MAVSNHHAKHSSFYLSMTLNEQTATIFRPKCHRLSAASYRQSRTDAFSLWTNYAAKMTA